MDAINKLITDLSELPWGAAPWNGVHEHVEHLLSDCWAQREDLFPSLESLLKKRACTLTVTAELQSWMLHDPGDWILKLNHFKPSPIVGRASEGIHNHMRPLTTLTLSGGYSQNYYFPERNYGDGEPYGTLPSSSGPTTKPGHVYTVGPEVFHAVNDFEDATLTLVIYGVIVRPAITRFDVVKGVAEIWGKHNAAKQEVITNLDRANQRCARHTDGRRDDYV